MSAIRVDHIWRHPLPWREETLTECGLSEPASALTRDETAAKVKREGSQRAAISTCQTCLSRYRWAVRWEDDPAGFIARQGNGPDRERINDDLRAAEALIAAHREEFDGFLTGLADTSSLAAHRLARRRARP